MNFDPGDALNLLLERLDRLIAALEALTEALRDRAAKQ